jgi:hypothetical protein
MAGKSLLDPRPAHGTESMNEERLTSEPKMKLEKGKIITHTEMQKNRFLLRNNKITTDPWGLPYSLPHLIIRI